MPLGGKTPVLKIGGDARPAQTALRNVGRGLERMKTIAVRVGRTIGKVLGAPFVMLKRLLGSFRGQLLALLGVGGAFIMVKRSIESALDQREGIRRLRSAVEAQGESWGKWKQQIDSTLRSIQDFTNYGDEEQRAVMTHLLNAGLPVNKMYKDMATVMDLVAASGQPAADFAKDIATAYVEGLPPLKTYVPAIQNLIYAIEAEQKSLGRLLTIEERWNRTMQFTRKQFPDLARKMRQENPFPALINEVGNLNQLLGDLLSKYLNPVAIRLTNLAKTLQEIDIGTMFKETIMSKEWWGKVGGFMGLGISHLFNKVKAFLRKQIAALIHFVVKEVKLALGFERGDWWRLQPDSGNMMTAITDRVMPFALRAPKTGFYTKATKRHPWWSGEAMRNLLGPLGRLFFPRPVGAAEKAHPIVETLKKTPLELAWEGVAAPFVAAWQRRLQKQYPSKALSTPHFLGAINYAAQRGTWPGYQQAYESPRPFANEAERRAYHIQMAQQERLMRYHEHRMARGEHRGEMLPALI